MTEQKIIINGRELNNFQKYLFNIRSEVISAVLYIPMIALAFIPLIKLRQYQMQNSIIGLAMTIFMTVLAIYLYNDFIKRKVFINGKNYYEPRYKGLKEALGSSWIINRQMIEDMLYQNWYESKSIKTEVLKTCFGHELFEDMKIRAFSDIKEMISYIQNPTPNMINQVLNYKDISEGKYLFKKPFTFKNQSLTDLQAYYAFAIGLKSADKFAWKAIRLKSKEQLVEFLDKKLVDNA